MGFIERINDLFSERGTQARCSQETGIAQSLLSNYRKDKVDPSLTNAVLIADFFDVSLDWLAGREGFERDAHRRTAPPLPPDESALLADYRSCTARERTVIRATASTMADGGHAKNDEHAGAERAG